MACDSHARTCQRYVQLSYDLALSSRNNMLRCMQDHQQAVTPRGHHARVGMQTKRVVVLWAVGKAAKGVRGRLEIRVCHANFFFKNAGRESRTHTHIQTNPNPHTLFGPQAGARVLTCPVGPEAAPEGAGSPFICTAGVGGQGWTYILCGELEPKNRTSHSRIGPTQCGALGSPQKTHASNPPQTFELQVRVLASCPSDASLAGLG